MRWDFTISNRGALVALGLVLSIATLAAQAPDLSLLGKAPWPGMSAWDVAWCRDVVYRAGFVEIRQDGQVPRVVWIKDARGWLKPNGFYGLKLNGQPVDETQVWVNYQGTMTNLRLLFTYGSEAAQGVKRYRD